MKTIFFFCSFLLSVLNIAAQIPGQTVNLFDNKKLVQVNVNTRVTNYTGKKALEVTGNGVTTETTFVKLNDFLFKDGIIEVEMSGQPGVGSSDQARGFVGVAFRINNDNSKFECIYIRPTNGRSDDQVRRNHSVQYISFPDFPWHKLRKEFPEKYESYVDLVPAVWTKVKIEVKGASAKLYVHGNAQPALVVNDLKLGTDAAGSIGLWIGPGTLAHFSGLHVQQ
jgi:hypothetical protein